MGSMRGAGVAGWACHPMIAWKQVQDPLGVVIRVKLRNVELRQQVRAWGVSHFPQDRDTAQATQIRNFMILFRTCRGMSENMLFDTYDTEGCSEQMRRNAEKAPGQSGPSRANSENPPVHTG